MSDKNSDHAAFPLMRALSCKCPNCGEGRLFKGLLSLGYLENCSSCHLEYSKFDAGDGPAVPIMMILGFMVMIAAVVLEFKYEPPVWVHVIIWGPVVYFGSVGMLKVGKALMAAADHFYNAGEAQLKNRPEAQPENEAKVRLEGGADE
jgi:uncharacterized protein (DUF983 family)